MQTIGILPGGGDRYASGIALEGRLGEAYDEKAFRYFLAMERKRSERSGLPFLLLLVDLKQQPGVSTRFDPTAAVKIFSGLWRCLRETDVIGWFHEERVAGAVLTQLADRPPTEVSRVIRQRVGIVLCEHLSSEIATRLQVRVHQLQPNLMI
jgi:hypothetical protein